MEPFGQFCANGQAKWTKKLLKWPKNAEMDKNMLKYLGVFIEIHRNSKDSVKFL